MRKAVAKNVHLYDNGSYAVNIHYAGERYVITGMSSLAKAQAWLDTFRSLSPKGKQLMAEEHKEKLRSRANSPTIEPHIYQHKVNRFQVSIHMPYGIKKFNQSYLSVEEARAAKAKVLEAREKLYDQGRAASYAIDVLRQPRGTFRFAQALVNESHAHA